MKEIWSYLYIYILFGEFEREKSLVIQAYKETILNVIYFRNSIPFLFSAIKIDPLHANKRTIISVKCFKSRFISSSFQCILDFQTIAVLLHFRKMF